MEIFATVKKCPYTFYSYFNINLRMGCDYKGKKNYKRASDRYFLRECKLIVCKNDPRNNILIMCNNCRLISKLITSNMYGIDIFIAHQ